jgi:hypothetical protein
MCVPIKFDTLHNFFLFKVCLIFFNFQLVLSDYIINYLPYQSDYIKRRPLYIFIQPYRVLYYNIQCLYSKLYTPLRTWIN